MKQGHRALGLQILVDGKSYDRVIQSGESVIVGRDSSAQVVLPLDSISTQHLQVMWDGERVLVRDLDSSNGTFRMPQDAPFAEAQFDPSTSSSLKLRLSKVPLDLSWFVLDAEQMQSEKTQILEPKLPALTPSSAPAKSPSTPSPKVPAIQNLSSSSSAKVARRTAHDSGVPAFVVSGLVFALSSLLFYFIKYADFVSASWAFLRLGQSVDLYLFWLEELFVFAGLGIASLLLFFFLKAKHFSFPVSRVRLLAIPGFLFWITPFLVPLAALSISIKPLETFEAASRFRSIRSSLQTHDYSNKESNVSISSELNTLSKSLMGSSIYYTFWHNFQKKRVINECGGVGSGVWQKKRFCLTLLFALSLESYSKIRPVFLRRTASNLVLLSSLDGVVRVLAAEGPESEHLKIFINSLDDAGLVDEVRAFLSLVQSFKGRRFEDLMKALLDVRFQLEARLMDLQKKSQLPKQLSLNLMGPLEMGI